METLAWAAYAVFLVGPYVLAVIAFFLLAYLISTIAIKTNKLIGTTITLAIAIVIGFTFQRWFIAAPSAFNAACASGVGPSIYKAVKADSYRLQHEPESGGLVVRAGLTLKDAVQNVAFKKVRYVEFEDSSDPVFTRHYADGYGLTKFKGSESTAGFYRIFVSNLGSKQCRWVMPNDVAPLRYEVYISYGIAHKLNRKLNELTKEKECIAVEYVMTPSSQYFLNFKKEDLGGSLLKHSIVATDTLTQEIIGEIVSYENKPSNIFASVAFWLGNNKSHQRCPLNVFEVNAARALLAVR